MHVSAISLVLFLGLSLVNTIFAMTAESRLKTDDHETLLYPLNDLINDFVKVSKAKVECLENTTAAHVLTHALKQILGKALTEMDSKINDFLEERIDRELVIRPYQFNSPAYDNELNQQT